MSEIQHEVKPKRRTNAPSPSSDAARSRMLAVRQRGTKPELAVMAQLDRLGLTYMHDTKPELSQKTRADFVLHQARVAVFIDGCFWHACPTHASRPKANAAWWVTKLDANVERDAQTTRCLQEAGWRVLRFWAHEDPSTVAATIATTADSGYSNDSAL